MALRRGYAVGSEEYRQAATFVSSWGRAWEDLILSGIRRAARTYAGAHKDRGQPEQPDTQNQRRSRLRIACLYVCMYS